MAAQLQYQPNVSFSPAARLLNFFLSFFFVGPRVSPSPVGLWAQPITTVIPFLQQAAAPSAVAALHRWSPSCAPWSLATEAPVTPLDENMTTMP
jgi:hypothetical protein